MRLWDTEGFEFFGGLSFHDTERSEILRGLSYHDKESEAPFTLRKIFGTASDKNGTCTKKCKGICSTKCYPCRTKISPVLGPSEKVVRVLVKLVRVPEILVWLG